MLRWVPYPFIRLTLAFTLGILLALRFPAPNHTHHIWSIAFLGMILIIVGKIFFSRLRQASIVAGLGGLLGLMTLGYQHTLLRTQAYHPQHLTHITYPIHHLSGTVIGAEEERERTWRTELAISEIHTDSGWQAATGTILLYQRKDSLHQALQYGDQIVVAGTPQRIPENGNPGAFDYRRYLANQQIHHQLFGSGKDIVMAGHAPPNWAKALAIQTQLAFRDRLDSALSEQRETAIVWALVIGDKGGLEPDTRQAYATAGAMHVLAVSGLHVGIIYLVLLKLLGGLRRRPLGRWLFAAWVLLALWSFAFVTGLSPSVLRAATMFSFMVLAQTTQRKVSTYNTLAASAFLLLCFNPLLITSVGFQLSYLAVFGIVYLQPKLYSWWTPQSRALDWVWQLTTVSIAAQLATVPLAVYYFHTFPTYFFLSNLLVVPLATIILVGGLLVLLTGPISIPLSDGLGSILEKIVWLMNEAIFLLEKIPGSRMEDLMLTPGQVLCLCGGILSFLAFWKFLRFRYLLYTTITCLLLASMGVIQHHRILTQTGFTFYKVRGVTAANFYQGTQHHLLWDSPSGFSPDDYRYQILGHEQQLGFRPHQAPTLPDSTRWRTQGPWQLTAWQGKVIARLSQTSRFSSSATLSTPIDYLVISHNAIGSIEDLPESLKGTPIILDSSNKSYIAARLATEAEALQWPCHNINRAGAFTATW